MYKHHYIVLVQYEHTVITLYTSDTSTMIRILLRKQQQHFQPVIKWFKRTFKIDLGICQGTLSGKINHGQVTVDRLSWIVHQLDEFSLTGNLFQNDLHIFITNKI